MTILLVLLCQHCCINATMTILLALLCQHCCVDVTMTKLLTLLCQHCCVDVIAHVAPKQRCWCLPQGQVAMPICLSASLSNSSWFTRGLWRHSSTFYLTVCPFQPLPHGERVTENENPTLLYSLSHRNKVHPLSTLVTDEGLSHYVC